MARPSLGSMVRVIQVEKLIVIHTVPFVPSNDSAVTGQGRQGTESIMGWNDPPSITPYRPEATRTFLSQSGM